MNKIPLAWWTVMPFFLFDIQPSWLCGQGSAVGSGFSFRRGVSLLVGLVGGKLKYTRIMI